MTDRGHTPKRPASQFYWGDHLRDLAVRSVSLAARGLWVDMMSLMHEGDPYGHLRTGKQEITPRLLARMVGAPVGAVKKLLTELEDAGVFSRDDDGVIYSRRMVRDERLRNARAAGGPLSLTNPNVPRKKDRSAATSKDQSEDTLQTDAHPSIDPSPASSSSSASASSSSSASSRLCADGESKPRHHGHAYCPTPRSAGFCIPQFLHDDFVMMLGRHAQDFDLMDWYPSVGREAALNGSPILNINKWLRGRLKAEMLQRHLVEPDPGQRASAAEQKRAEYHTKQTGGCRHEPGCADDAAHKRLLINRWRETAGVGPLPPAS